MSGSLPGRLGNLTLLNRGPVPRPLCANLRFTCTGVVGRRDKRRGSLHADEHYVADRTADATLPVERDDLVEGGAGTQNGYFISKKFPRQVVKVEFPENPALVEESTCI